MDHTARAQLNAGAVTPGELGTPDLSLEHAQLLTEEGVFEYQLLLGAGYIEDGIEGERIVVRLGPLARWPFDGLLDRAKSS
ncbi:MAG: hypothetical protein AB8I69_21715 [Anaerolineae bacterium]